MADQIIDVVEVAIPGQMGDVTPAAIAARDAAQQAATDAATQRGLAEGARDAAEVFAAGARELQDTAVDTLISDGTSASNAAVREVSVGVADYQSGLLNSSPRPDRPRVTKNVLVPVLGHGWSGTDVVNFAISNVSGPMAGSILQFATDPAVPTGYIEKGSLGIDATGSGFLVWLSLTHPTETTVRLRAGNSAMTDYFEWTITVAGTGIGGRMILTSEEFLPVTLNFASAQKVGSPNRATIDKLQVVSTCTTGSNRRTRVGGIQMIDEQQGGVVSFTFDDSWKDHFTVAAPKLEEYGYRGTFYTIADPVVQGYSQYMSLSDLHDLQDSGHEIASHASSITAHSTGFDAMTRSQLVEEFRKIKGWLAENGFNGRDHLAFPMGRNRPQDADIYRQFFSTARATTGFQQETVRPYDPMRLRCLYVHQSTPASEVNAAIDLAKEYGSWLILCFHKLRAAPAADDEYPISDFNSIVDACQSKSMRVATIGDVVSGQFRGLA